MFITNCARSLHWRQANNPAKHKPLYQLVSTLKWHPCHFAVSEKKCDFSFLATSISYMVDVGGTSIKGLDDFELISFLVVKG
jgi:hypothetical protein